MTTRMTTSDVRSPAPVDIKTPDDNDQRFWSVTTIISALDKPALVYWSAETVALAAARAAGSLQRRIEEDGVDATVKWLADARYRRPQGKRSAAELGTAVHDACEQYALTGVRPTVDDEVAPFLNQFDTWLNKFQPTYLAAEVTVFSPTYGVAGTADGWLEIDGVPLIFDYKTSAKSVDKKGNPTGPYPEAALQLAAYRHAELAAVWQPRRYEKFRRRYYLLNEAEKQMAVTPPAAEAGIVIHITPEHCEAHIVECGPDIYEAFLFVLEAARYQFETSKRVIGPILERSK